MPLKGIFLQVTFPKVHRYGIMATQLLATWTIVYHPLKCGIVVYLVNLVTCSAPSLQRYASSLSTRDVAMSFRELILSGSIFERSVLLESPSSLHVMLTGFLRARRQDKDGVQINVHLKCNLDREDCTSLHFPFILPYA